MDTIKKNLPLILAGVATSSLILYLLFRKGDNTTTPIEEEPIIQEFLDQRAM